MAKFQVVAEQNVGKGGTLRMLLRGHCQSRLGNGDDHVGAGELLEEGNDAEEVGDCEIVAGVATEVEQVLCEERVLGDACSC